MLIRGNILSSQKIIVITGSTRGIGFGLADAFLSSGHKAVINGRSIGSVTGALNILKKKHSKEVFDGLAGNVTSEKDMKDLWIFAKNRFGKVDIWINNAGLGQPELSLSDLPYQQAEEIVHTNICGSIAGTRVALSGMKEQGHGAIYLMEGLGSDGRIVPKVSVYGASKYAVHYLIRALALETRHTQICIGGISPGMVATELLIGGYDKSSKEWQKVKNIFNILADKTSTVAPWIAGQVLSNKKNGHIIKWLTTGKILYRFMSSAFVKRHIIE
jgi:NAD(P)-dependent dehydrogenase (short-subunit alcohol dehydrogenase family)